MSIPDFLNAINTGATNFKFVTKPEMPIKEIEKIQSRLGIKLPDDLIDFYAFTNGLEGDDNFIFNIIPLNEVEKLKDEEGEYLTFAEYLIYSETCGFAIDQADKNKYKFFICLNSVEDPSVYKRKYIADSLIDLIKLYCDGGTLEIFGIEPLQLKEEIKSNWFAKYIRRL